MRSESSLFYWLSVNHYESLVKSKNPVSRWDCYDINSKERIELKCRKKHYSTLILEKPKYLALLKEAQKHNDTPIYINSTPEGIYKFNLLEIKPIWIKKRLPKTTQFQSRQYIEKELTLLNIKNSKAIWTKQ